MVMGTVIVTGASGGLGGPISRYLCEVGYDVIAHYRSIEPGLHDVDPGDRGKYHKVKADLTAPKQARELVDAAALTNTELWGVVNCAGGSINGMSWNTSAEDFANVLEQNVLTMHNVIKEAIPVLRGSGCGGRIVNISSVVAETGIAGAAAYAASKAAVIGYTKSLALELAPKGITANAIAAGYFEAGLIRDVNDNARSHVMGKIPLSRLGKPLELAAAVEFLLRDDAGYITGQVLGVNGGMR